MIANSQKQPLLEHLSAVGVTSSVLLDNNSFNPSLLDGELPLICKIAGFYHDIGKVDRSFQAYINKTHDYDGQLGEVNEYALTSPLHHEISLLVFIASWKSLKKWLQQQDSNLQGRSLKDWYEVIKYAIYWHHAHQVREVPLETVMRQYYHHHPDYLEALAFDSNTVLSNLFDASVECDIDDLDDALEKIKAIPFIDVTSVTVSKQKMFDTTKASIEQNASYLIARFHLVRADRYVSSLSPANMHTAIDINPYDDTKLLTGVKTYMDKASYQGERTEQQITAAKDLAKYASNTLVGPAGCGKTRIALIDYYYARTENSSSFSGIVWMVPRVVVGLGVLDELRQECPSLRISIITGEYKGVYQGEATLEQDNLYDADIIITTVDQIAKRLTVHGLHDEFSVFLERFVVFDEYHELFYINSLYWISLLLMRMKEWQSNAHRFISATPEPFHLKLIAQDDVTYSTPIVVHSFNDKPVVVSFSDAFELNKPDQLVIANTATKAQTLAISAFMQKKGEFDCFHSKFSITDKRHLTQHILTRYGKGSIPSGHTLYSGPIAQAALNISRGEMITEASLPANLLQRLGRSNRFGEHPKAIFSVLIDNTCMTEEKGAYGYYGQLKNTGVTKQEIINGNVVNRYRPYMARLSYAFLRYLSRCYGNTDKEPLNGCSFTTDVNTLMTHYMAFWSDKLSGSEESLGELFEYVVDSAKLLMHYKSFMPCKYIVTELSGEKTSFINFRGNSFYATMHELNISDSGDLAKKGFIAAGDNAADLVSVNANDIDEIPIIDNMPFSPFPSVVKLAKSIKYIAKHTGQSQYDVVTTAAKSQDAPLTCSHLNTSNSELVYVTLGENKQAIGFMSSKIISKITK